MEINSLWKLITRQGLGAAVVGNLRNRKCVFWREVIDTQAAGKFLVFAKKSKHRCPASSCGSEVGGKPGCVGWKRLPKPGREGTPRSVFLVMGWGAVEDAVEGDWGSELEGSVLSCHSEDTTWS